MAWRFTYALDGVRELARGTQRLRVISTVITFANCNERAGEVIQNVEREMDNLNPSRTWGEETAEECEAVLGVEATGLGFYRIGTRVLINLIEKDLPSVDVRHMSPEARRRMARGFVRLLKALGRL